MPIVELKDIDSVLLKRLIAEVKQEKEDDDAGIVSYNRVHNRHNRGG